MKQERNFYPLKGVILGDEFVLYLKNQTTNSLLVLTPVDTGNGQSGMGLSGPIRLSVRNGSGKIILDTIKENNFV
jgi:hypothetical protein